MYCKDRARLESSLLITSGCWILLAEFGFFKYWRMHMFRHWTCYGRNNDDEICFIFYFDKELEISFLNIRLVCLEHSLPRVPSRQLLFHSVTHVDEPLSLSVWVNYIWYCAYLVLKINLTLICSDWRLLAIIELINAFVKIFIAVCVTL